MSEKVGSFSAERISSRIGNERRGPSRGSGETLHHRFADRRAAILQHRAPGVAPGRHHICRRGAELAHHRQTDQDCDRRMRKAQAWSFGLDSLGSPSKLESGAGARVFRPNSRAVARWSRWPLRLARWAAPGSQSLPRSFGSREIAGRSRRHDVSSLLVRTFRTRISNFTSRVLTGRF